MNCTYHPDQAAVAYCRTCGKALCANCTRPVRGIIYCEDCLGARMEGARTASPPTAYQQVMDQGLGMKVPPLAPAVAPAAGSGPNPTVAGILAGFFPFGVGAVYTGQYAKGLAHLVIFGVLIAGCNAASNSSHGDVLGVVCGIGLAFFYVYQIVDAVRSARALQAGLPPPDPYGLAATFGGGARIEPSKAPIGAIVLIVIGGLFLLNTMGVNFGLDRLWPVILIVIGGWMFARNYGLAGVEARRKNLDKIEGFASQHGNPALMQQAIAVARCQCPRCRARRITGPAMLVTIGVLFLLMTTANIGFGRTWPILLLVIGGIQLLQHSASTEGHISFPQGQAVPPAAGASSAPPNVPPPPVPPPPAAPSEPGEVSHG